MRWRLSWAVVIGICIIIGVVTVEALLWRAYQHNKGVIHSSVYSGRVYMNTEEYEDFKSMLVDRTDIDIKDIEVLSSENPLVIFRVEVEGSGVFPYGERYVRYKNDAEGRVGLMQGIGIVGLVVVLITLSESYKRREGAD